VKKTFGTVKKVDKLTDSEVSIEPVTPIIGSFASPSDENNQGQEKEVAYFDLG
jgi:hypothetical protein